jgi:hypothetical protein
MGIASVAFDELSRLAADLVGFAGRLLRGPRCLDDLRLLERPAEWCERRLDWDNLFERAHVSCREGLLSGFASLMEQAWELHGGDYSVCGYEAIEGWLRSNTLLAHGYVPRLTVISLWLTTAIHNWLWWQAHPNRPAHAATVARGQLTSRDDKLARDVDTCLKVLADNERRLQFGDLVAMHVMAVNLGRVMKDSLKDLTAPELSRLARIQSANALSRIAAIASPEAEFLSRGDDDHLSGIALLLDDPGATGVREYLASHLGQRALRGLEDGRRQVTRLLASLAAATPGPQGAAQAFVGRVLRGALGTTDREDSAGVWQPWCAGWKESRSLAHFCGRVANWAERQTQRLSSEGMSEVEWLWRELARATLRPWANGHGSAILAWGCWIEGFLGEGTPPPLVLGRSALGQTFRQMITSWRIAVDRENRIASLLNSSSPLASSFSTLEGLAELRSRLEDKPEFKNVPQEELLAAPAVRPGEPAAPTRPAEPQRRWSGEVRVYRYPSNPKEKS